MVEHPKSKPNQLGFVTIIVYIVGQYKYVHIKKTKTTLHYSLLNFGTDFTDVTKRRGGVYPWFRSAGLGYFYGGDIKDRQDDGWKGVCAQV